MTTRPKFLLFGSSIVQYNYYDGWGAILSHLYGRKADIILRGYSGWNSRRALQIVHKILPKDAIEQPALMIVYFGGNDSIRPHPSGLGPHVPLEEFINNMRNIALYIRRTSPETRVIFLSTPPVNEEKFHDNIDEEGNKKRTNVDCHLYSEACLELCLNLNIKAIDLWSALQKREDWKDAIFLDDGVHFNAEGNKLIANEILKALREAEWEPSLHWKSMPVDFGEDSPYDPVNPDATTTINISNIPFPFGVEWKN